MTNLLYMINRDDLAIDYGDANDWTNPKSWGVKGGGRGGGGGGGEAAVADGGGGGGKEFEIVHINDFTSEEIKVSTDFVIGDLEATASWSFLPTVSIYVLPI